MLTSPVAVLTLAPIRSKQRCPRHALRGSPCHQPFKLCLRYFFFSSTDLTTYQKSEPWQLMRSNRSNPSNLSQMDDAAGPTSLRGLKCPMPLYFKKGRSVKVNQDTDLDQLRDNWIKVRFGLITRTSLIIYV